MEIETLQQEPGNIGIIPFVSRPHYRDSWEITGVQSVSGHSPLYCVVRVLIVTKFLVRDVENCKEGRDCNEALRGRDLSNKTAPWPPSCQR